MQRNAVQCNEEAASISNTFWAYVPCRYDTSRRQEIKSSTLLSRFCCCFTNDDNPYAPTNDYVNSTLGDDPPVTLSQALLCIDNPQIPNDLVSYPISEETILEKHRCHNVMQQPHVIRSTQMLFMGFDVKSLQEIDIQQRLSQNEANPTNSHSCGVASQESLNRCFRRSDTI